LFLSFKIVRRRVRRRAKRRRVHTQSPMARTRRNRGGKRKRKKKEKIPMERRVTKNPRWRGEDGEDVEKKK